MVYWRPERKMQFFYPIHPENCTGLLLIIRVGKMDGNHEIIFIFIVYCIVLWI